MRLTPLEIKEQLRRKREAPQAAEAPPEIVEDGPPVRRIEIGNPNGYEHPEPTRRRGLVSGKPNFQDKIPQSMDAEKGILGSILLAPERCMRLCEREIGKNFFYHPAHSDIYEAMTEMHQDSTPIDLISLTQYLDDTGRLDKVGGAANITDLFTFVPTASNIPYYIELVQEKHALRLIHRLGQEMSYDAVHAHTIRPADLIERAKDELASLSGLKRHGRLPNLDDMSLLIGENRPPLPPELVKGILHQGNKIIIGGTSKGRKTFSLMDLAVSVSTGMPWWGFETIKGKVCYINFEIQKPFFVQRFETLCRAIGATPCTGNFMSYTLRGMVDGIEKMSDMLIRDLVHHDFTLIIVDPIYKALGDRDENKAGDVASLCNELERIAVRTGAAIAFGAHYSKGNQAAKESIDRIGGSGVFARDPDTILTMTAHEEDDCFTVDVTLRNFAPLNPFVLRWDWPLFVRDDLLNPEKIKKPKKMVHGSNGQFPEKFSEPDVIEVLVRQGDIGRRTEEARKLIMNETGMSSRSFYRIWKKLQETARITQKDGRWFTV